MLQVRVAASCRTWSDVPLIDERLLTGSQAQPAMAAPPFTGRQLAILAEQLAAVGNWQLQQQN